MNAPMLAMFLADKAEVDVTPHIDLVTSLLIGVIALLIAFFAVRPELWRRMLFQRVDPRPAAMMRIVFGFVVLLTFVDLLKPHGPLDDSVARFLFTDEGLWLTDMARSNYGGQLKTLWDPEHGFQNWYDLFRAIWGKFSLLHFRSDPTFVFGLYWLMLASLTLMIFGVWTRATTVISWILVESVYSYSPVFYTGGDTVVRVFLFLGMFAQWGQAYSFDSWRRRRKAILGGAKEMPPLRLIPAWPMRLMMLQLAIIYCATGLLKSGSTWTDGTALYYALNLDHFYRWPQMGLVGAVHYLKILPVMVIAVHWWEILFPLAMLGAAVNAFERERADGTWPAAALWRRVLSYALLAAAWSAGAYIAGLAVHYYLPDPVLAVLHLDRPSAVRLAIVIALAIPVVVVALYLGLRKYFPRVHVFVRHWMLGKRFWLVFGFGMHVGIDLGMNVGTFANVMMAVYLAWLSGEEIEAFWRWLMSQPLTPGEGDRPARKGWRRRVLAPLDRLRYRIPGRRVVVLHNPEEASVRRAALLRVWDLGDRLEFQADPDVPSERLWVRLPGDHASRSGADAGYALIRIMPGLWWIFPGLWTGLFRRIPVVPAACGWLVLKLLRQHR